MNGISALIWIFFSKMASPAFDNYFQVQSSGLHVRSTAFSVSTNGTTKPLILRITLGKSYLYETLLLARNVFH